MSWLLTILGWGWAIGCIVIALLVLKWLWCEESPLISICVGLILTPLALLMAALPYLIYAQETSPDLATLKRNEWVCTATRTRTTYVLVNRTMTPIISNECITYNRIR